MLLEAELEVGVKTVVVVAVTERSMLAGLPVMGSISFE